MFHKTKLFCPWCGLRNVWANESWNRSRELLICSACRTAFLLAEKDSDPSTANAIDKTCAAEKRRVSNLLANRQRSKKR